MAAFNHHTNGIEVVQRYRDAVQGKTIVITGTSNKGLGAETAISLAHGQPDHLVLVARSEVKVKPVINTIRDISPGTTVTFVSIELDDTDSIRKGAATINQSVEKIDILINNAGIMAVKDFTMNEAGIETQFATNHVGHFLLTYLLYEKVACGGLQARIVNLTSDGYMIGPCRLEDYNFNNGKDYDQWSGYGQSKTANILFTRGLATRGIVSFAVHPGVIFETGLSEHLGPDDFQQISDIAFHNTGQQFEVGVPKSKQQGVATTLVAALDPSIADRSGSYLVDCAVEPLRDYASSQENAQKLWNLSERLVGQKFEI